MAYEMENSSTGNATKIAVMWNERGKGGSGGGVSDLFVDAVMRGAYTELHNGTGLGAVKTVFTGSDKLSLYGAVFHGHDQMSGPSSNYVSAFNQAAQNGDGLRSLADMIADIRTFLRLEGPSGVQSTEPLRNGTDPDVLPQFGGVYAALETIMSHIERLEERLESHIEMSAG